MEMYERGNYFRHIAATTLAVYGSCASSLVARALGADSEPDFLGPSGFFVVLFLFSLFGGLGRLLLLWKPSGMWQHRTGAVILGVFGSWIIALYYWGDMQPTKLMALAGAMAAVGGEIVEQVLRMLVSRQLPELPKDRES